jgi:hypothetical protein
MKEDATRTVRVVTRVEGVPLPTGYARVRQDAAGPCKGRHAGLGRTEQVAAEAGAARRDSEEDVLAEGEDVPQASRKEVGGVEQDASACKPDIEIGLLRD